ncbi:hypothetical protein D3C71_2097330 [compost metagenome]
MFLIHTDFIQKLIFAFGLYTFGNHPEPERFGRRDDGAYQRLRNRIAIHPTHEAFIQLDGIQRNAGQLGQRRVAGAKIIEMHLRSQIA